MKLSRAILVASPYLLILLGVVLNQAAVYANGGHMPVYPPGGNCSVLNPDDIVHSCMTKATHLKILGDWIISSLEVSSIGDVLQGFGDMLKVPSLIFWCGLILKDICKK